MFKTNKRKIEDDELANIYWRLECIQNHLMMVKNDVNDYISNDENKWLTSFISDLLDEDHSEIEELQDKIRKARKIKTEKIEG